MKKDFVSLAEARPDLAKEWNYEKNGDLKPEDVSCGSNKKVWWKLPYDVPNDYPVEHLRGKHFEFEWIALIGDRNSKNLGCPFLSGQSVWNGFNDLTSVRPDLAKQWHPTKNGNLRPTEVAVNSMKKVWWLFSYDVPMNYSAKHLRGKHYDFEWSTTVANRNKGNGCPFLNGHAVWPGFNDLQTVNPELAKQWHPTKNGNLKPTEVTANSNRKVWWLFPYDDPKTGQHFDFEWSSTISSRNIESGCPFLYGKAVLKEFNDLQTANPELAAQWHPTKNGNLRPEDVSFGSNKRIWWLLPYDVPMNYSIKHLRGEHFDFEWQATISERNSRKRGCPYLSGNAVWKGFNDLQTVNPELSKQWHPTKNGNLKPTEVTANSNRKVWWLFPYDDPETGKHFNFEWKESIVYRNKTSISCPFLSGKAVWFGFNDLQTVNPKLAKQWHPTKNGSLKPTEVTCGVTKKVWWLFPYDDPETGRHHDFEWQASIQSRHHGGGCPYLSHQTIQKGFNDLQTTNPELAKQWHPTKNGNLKPTEVTANSNRRVWWLFPYDDPKTGKHFDFEWQASIHSRNFSSGCPYLSGQTICKGFNDLATKNPDIAAQWHPTKNGDLKPTNITSGSKKKVWWLFPYNDPKTGKHFDFEWQASVNNRTNHNSCCPFLNGRAVWEGFNDLQTVNPELAKQWHPTRNGSLKPTQVTEKSGITVWWLFPYDDPKTGKHFDFEWKSKVVNRSFGCGCPYLTIYKGEEYIKQYLEKNNISFNVQQRFSDLRGTGDGQLSYDFSIPDEKYVYILIEYNGIQHYESVEYWGGKAALKKQKEHDKRKRDYAKKHGYKLITIKYTYDTYESVEEYLDKEFEKLGIINDSVNLCSPSPDVDGVSGSQYTSSNHQTDGQPKIGHGFPSIDDTKKEENVNDAA